MTKFYKILSFFCFCLLISVAAAEPHDQLIEKRIVIETEGDLEDKTLGEILDEVSLAIDGATDVNVFVTVDDEGNVNIEKLDEPGQRHTIRKIVRLHGRPHGSFDHTARRHGIRRADAFFGSAAQGQMTEAAATCILKNLVKVNSDAEAHLLDRACRTLNPASD